MVRRRSGLALVAAVLAASCAASAPERPPRVEVRRSVTRALVAAPEDLALRRVAPARIVAIGDLHGDLERSLRALRVAGAVGGEGDWVGGSLVTVQVGDRLDRGDDDRALFDRIERLRRQARDDGGDLVTTLGNHEILNASLDFRYVTGPSLAAFDDLAVEATPEAAGLVRSDMIGRAGAFAPGGRYARALAESPILEWFGDTVFVHAGLLPEHVRYGLARLDRETRAWLRGERWAAPRAILDEDGPLWTRAYGEDPTPEACAALAAVLRALGARRMVVGHTPRGGGIDAACDERVWRIDVGISAHFGGPIEVLEIAGDEVRVLAE